MKFPRWLNLTTVSLGVIGIGLAASYWLDPHADEASISTMGRERNLHALIDSEYRSNRVWPVDLQSLLKRPNRNGMGRDAWGRTIRVEFKTTSYVLRSAGLDGRFATRDDIVRHYERPSL
jgi:hypothetical protein